jgi:hypothetical protein
MGPHRNDVGEKGMMTGRNAPWDERSTREAGASVQAMSTGQKAQRA